MGCAGANFSTLFSVFMFVSSFDCILIWKTNEYRGCLELWIDGRKPGAGFDFNSEIAGSIVRAAL